MYFLKTFWPFMILFGVIGYTFGSLNFAILLTRKYTDIRKIGSGNAGFTNVVRSGNKNAAVFTLCGDMLKCVVAILVSWFILKVVSHDVFYPYMYRYATLVAGGMCVIGHVFPCFFQFKGGKGIATAAMLILFLDVRVFVVIISIYAIVFFTTKIVSLASVVSAISYPIFTFLFDYFFEYRRTLSGVSLQFVIISSLGVLIISTVILVKHRDNIKRLIQGEEKPVVKSKA